MTRPGGITFALTALTVLTAVAAAFTSNAPVSAGRSVRASANACPLTRAKEQTAVEAFKQMMPVLTHPRCLNCHGGVNPFVLESQGGHVGDKQDPKERPLQCKECHGKLPGWDVPGQPMFWVGKSAKELCVLFKDMSSGPADFIGHMFNEHGGTQFIATAFLGDRALNDFGKETLLNRSGRAFALEKPPITHPELMVHARDWANAIGTAGWNATPECGCGVTAKAWVGTVTTVFELHTATLGRLIETATSTVRFEIDSSFMTPGETTDYWKSVSGAIKWQTSATGGQCTGGGSGTVPIGLGSDLNPMSGLRMDPDASGPVRFTVSIGPWPDAYDAHIPYICRNAPPLVAPLFGATQWWGHHPDGETLSADGKTMIGTYKTGLGAGTMEWHWDLHLESFVAPN